MMKKIMAVAGLTVWAGAANAQLIVGDNGDNTVYNVNPITGASSALFTHTGGITALAADDTNQILYFTEEGSWDLYEVPYNTLTPSLIGNLTDPTGAPLSLMYGLGYDHANDRLMASTQSSSNPLPEGIYEIDRTNATATTLLDFAALPGGNGAYIVGGIDVDQVNGKVYGANDDPTPGPRGIYEFDIAGVNATLVAAYPAGETDLDGLAAHGDKIWLIEDSDNTTDELWEYDIPSGTYSVITPPWIDQTSFVSAGAYSRIIPAPGALALLGLGGLAAARRRR